MSLPKAYEPNEYEAKMYALWEQSGAFRPALTEEGGNTGAGNSGAGQPTGGTPFSVVVPPPNANGNLHLGHGLTLAIEDIMVRHHRLLGDPTLFVPGADHAGFETWVVYEKQLNNRGKSRFDFSRVQLFEQIWDFVAQNKDNYQQQFRQLGASVDWDSYTFTLDPKIIKQAHATFKKLWDDKLIYRDTRLVNYCTYHRTGFADIEVAYETVRTPLYYLKYGPFTLATTRPETKFGDTGVAVHPDDERYKEWVGKTVSVEGVNGPFEVRVVADEMVDPKFGTGVVKITPAHSFDDWEVAQRHNLPPLQVINHDGTMNHHAGPFEGLTVREAREAVVKKLDEMGLLVKTDTDYETRIGKCYKCGTVIEPMLLEQWFIDMQRLAAPALEALRAGQVEFQPAAKREQLIRYLENIRDWNVSRQIAWGIPIPAYQNVDEPDDWIYDERTDQEIIEVNGRTYHRDPDVFDTWFSSSSWPYATLDFPDGDKYKQFYPLSVMETGADILYAWVSRMLCFGLYNTGQAPFKSVYLHGLIMDEHGQKMSKSKGNVVNPIEKVQQYGSDAFRMGIIADESAGTNRPYDESKLVGARNFCNKLWNIARFIESLTEDGADGAVQPLSSADHWALSKLQQVQERGGALLSQNRLAEAYDLLYHFVWDDLADWYIEASKAAPNKPLLRHLLSASLRLLHPFAPFVTEAIWQNLAWQPGTVLAAQQYLPPLEFDAKQANEFERIQSVVTEVRLILSSLGASGVTLYHHGDPLLAVNAQLICKLAGLASVKEVKEGQGLQLTASGVDAWLDIDTETAKAYALELGERITKQQGIVKQLEGRLNNKAYVDGAPAAIVEQSRRQLSEAQEVLAGLAREQQRFS